MYDINLSATSIPSDIHLISSAPMFDSHLQDEHFYQQIFGSLADVVGSEYHKNFHTNKQQLYNCRFNANYTTHNSNNQRLLRSQKSNQHPSVAQIQSPERACSRRQPGTFSQQRQHWQQQTYRTQNHRSAEEATSELHEECPYDEKELHMAAAAAVAASAVCQPHCLTIEELKSTRNSCWLCGCNWQQDHVSLDCPECDGYALSRPCPNCDGKCKQVWQRNISATHDKHRALWTGHCGLESKSSAGPKQGPSAEQQQQVAIQTTSAGCSGAQQAAGQKQQTLAEATSRYCQLAAPPASSICSSRPSSAASSDDEPEDFLSI